MIAKFATIVFVCGASAALAGEGGPKTFRPIQAISYTFGSKAMTGYFVQDASLCHVFAMLAEKPDPDSDQRPLSATRVRLVMTPGEAARFDSEEGESVNLTCGEGGATVAVECLH